MDLAFANAFDILNECDWFRRLVTLQKVRAPLPAFCNWVRSVSASSLFSDLPEIPKRLAGLPEASPWYLAVAIGKLLLGYSFYGLSFLEIPSYLDMSPQYAPQVPEKIRKQVRKVAWGAVATLVTHFVLALLAAWALSRFQR